LIADFLTSSVFQDVKQEDYHLLNENYMANFPENAAYLARGMEFPFGETT
jgi:hypothetical protein